MSTEGLRRLDGPITFRRPGSLIGTLRPDSCPINCISNAINPLSYVTGSHNVGRWSVRSVPGSRTTDHLIYVHRVPSGMVSRSDWRLLLPERVRRLPFDLAFVFTSVVAVNVVVFLPFLRETPLVVFGVPFVLFVPGYAFIAALFPERSQRPAEGRAETPDGSRSTTDRGIDGIERVVLSVGLSTAAVPLLALVLNVTPFGIRPVPIMVTVSLFTVVMTIIAAYRRRKLPQEQRLRVPYRQWTELARTELFAPDSRTDAALNVLLIVSILLATASVAYAVAVPKQGDGFTATYLLTESDDGDLVADNYPTNFTVGEPQSLIVGVSNHEHERTDYTVVVELQNVTLLTNESAQVDRIRQNATRSGAVSIHVDRTVELDRFTVPLSHNETWHHEHAVTPPFAGDDLRLTYLVYRGDPPADPSTKSAYRWLALRVDAAPDT
ncbi:Membrane associated protein with extracellular Ig-like domain [Halorhabdus sp. BNX81]|nr:Membrane associated protein with extracellular Ig-like domain [Halorhabdus sp. BNX81]